MLVAEAVRRAAAAVADCVLDQAQADPSLQIALETIYGTERAALPEATVAAAQTSA